MTRNGGPLRANGVVAVEEGVAPEIFVGFAVLLLDPRVLLLRHTRSIILDS